MFTVVVALALLAAPAPLRSVDVLVQAARAAGDADARSRAVSDLGKRADAAAATALVSLAADPALGGDIAFALRSLTDVEAGPAVFPLLQSTDRRLRNATASLLEHIGDGRSAAPLTALLAKETDKGTKSAAVRALGHAARTEDDVAPLVRLLDDEEFGRDAQGAVQLVQEPKAAPGLFPGLKAKDPWGRKAVCRALGELSSPVAAGPLLDAAEKDPSDDVKSACAAAVGVAADASALPRLLKDLHTLSDNNALLYSFVDVDRANGFKETLKLGRAGDKLFDRVVTIVASRPHAGDEPVLRLALQRKASYGRQEALTGLSMVHTTGARDTVCDRLLHDPDNLVQGVAAGALSAWDDDVSVTCLIDGFAKVKLKGPGGVDEDIVRSLETITPEKFEYDAAWRAWHKSGLKDAGDVDATLKALGASDDGVRALAAQRLATAKDGAAASAALLTALGKERVSSVRGTMVTSLATLRAPGTADALVARLPDATDDDERTALCRALDDLGDARGTLFLIDKLAAGDGKAAAALSSITGEPAHGNVARWRAWWATQAERYRPR